MKYTKLFNNHSEYVIYTGSTGFITPNVSWCIEEQEAHCTPKSNLTNPVINCTNNEVTITCATVGAIIYYRLDETGNYSTYTESFTITADTIVEAYAVANGETSSTISEDCIYIPPIHDYSKDYLTFRVISGGTILWKTIGSITKSISYSKDDGETWTSITSTTTGTEINVSAEDKVLLKGTNSQYATSKTNYCAFKPGTATFDVEGNIMSLISGDSFTAATSFTSTYAFCSLFNESKVVSAENLIMPVMTLTNDCYRAMFANATGLTVAPALPATTVSKECYWYMFENCAITKAPDLPAETVGIGSYGHMFTGCTSLNYVKCLATNISASAATTEWLLSVSPTGTFVKDASMTSWTTGSSGIPNGWVVKDADSLAEPTIGFDGFNTIILSCETTGATIYYKLNNTGNYSAYTTAITITADTFIEAYSEENGETSLTVSQTCVYVSDDPFAYSNRSLDSWTYVNDSIDVTVPYSVNAIDGHSSHYKTDGDNPKLPFSFDTSFGLKEAQPTYLWFEHADQSADIYVDNTLVETHWGGYNAFFSDISNYVHSGTNNIRVSLRNKQRSDLAPCAGDFNFNATLGYVKLFTSPYLPDKEYGYDGFHVTSHFDYTTTANTTASAATISVKTSVPTGATVICTVNSGETNIYSASSASTGEEMIFTTQSLTGTSLHLWDGTIDPFLYTITLEVYHDGDLYHRYTRGYGLRYYEYVINDTTRYGTVENPFTGFKLNGHSYLLRGVCMHNDKVNKANALTTADIAGDFNIIQELGCNFIRLAHYPHPKTVYDTCDRLGIVVQTEVPWVNQSSSGQPEAYYTRLEGQCDDMVKQHYNHPCIFFWGLANEITPSTTSFTKAKIEQYTTQIKALDSERMVGFVMPMGNNSPANFGTPNVDWFGYNIYEGWYQNKNSNNPTNALNTRVNNTINNAGKPLAYSEYGCGGTPTCHSDDFMATTERGNYPRHDIEYMMWLHEGHIAAIKNFPQLMFTSQWQLFDIAVYNRQEGYKVCLDGETVTDNNDLKYLNDKGLVERDHVTKKDTFYLYKAWWNPTPFVHICGKNYEKVLSRVIKCYTNETGTLTMYVNGVSAATATVTNNIATFAARNFVNGDVIRVDGVSSTTDSFTIKGKLNYLTFVATDSGTFSFSNSGMSYSVDDGETWTTLASYVDTPTVSAGSKIMWKGTLTPSPLQRVGIGRFSSTGRFTIEGNIMSLLYGDNFAGQTALTDTYVFKELFRYTNVTSAENLLLPATALTQNCYTNMFYQCEQLETPPQLSATTLAESCYDSMFRYCDSLTTAPSLPATTLETSCYNYMFGGCSGLTTAPVLSAATLAEKCYNYMFFECTSLNNITCLATNISASDCTYNWVNGVSASGTFRKASSMSSWTSGNNGIPSGWSVQDAS